MDVIVDALPYLASGLGVTVALAFCLLLLGVVIGLGLSIVQVYGKFTLPFFATMIERLFRSVPAVVLLFLFFYGISIFYSISAFGAAVLALGIRSAAYQSQIFRGAIQSVPSGQILAAQSLGVTHTKAIFTVVLPQAIRQAISPWSNEAIAELKDTSLAFTIGVIELMTKAKFVVTATAAPILLVYGVAALFYLLVCIALTATLTAVRHRLAIPGFEHT